MIFLDWFKSKPALADVKERDTDSPKSAYLQREFDEHPAKKLTPAKLARIFANAEQGDLIAQAELFMDMEEQDAHIAAELYKRKMAVKKLDWSLKPPRNPSAKEKKQTQQLEDLIRDELDIGDIRMDMLDAIGHGYACLELGWEQNESAIWLPKNIERRTPTWFVTPIEDRNTLHLRVNSSAYGEPLTPFGWIPHIHKTRSGYIARTGLHRVLAWPFLYKNYSARDLAEFLEIYGLPIRVGKYPVSAGAKEKNDLLRTLLSIGHNAAGIIPESMQFELQSIAATGNADAFMAMINWCEASISKAILGGTLTSQTGSNGNRSLGDVHNEVRLDIRDDDATQIDQSLSAYLVYPIATFNGWFADNRCPTFVSDTQEPDDLALFADAIPKLVGVGVRIPQSYVNGKLKIPEPDENEPILGITQSPPQNPPINDNPVPTALAALGGKVSLKTPDPTPGDVYAGQLVDQGSPVLTGWLNSIRALVENADSLEALQADLLDHYGHLETGDLANVMSLALASAELAGRYDVQSRADAR